VVVAGGFNPKYVAGQVRESFGVLGRRPRAARIKTKEKQSRPAAAIRFKESDQSHLALGIRAFNMFDGRRHALSVLADVLGGGMSSRLFKKVREEMGAAYYVNAGPDLYLDHGYLGISAGVDHAKITNVLGAVMGELKRLSQEEVPARELQKSKDHLVGGLVLGLETSDELASFYGSEELLTRKILRPKQIIDKIQDVKAEEVRAVARAIFKNEKLNLAVIGPYKNPKVFRKILRL
jgi:predicted Zn-dependent peptidase